MTKLDTIIERVRALPADAQDALADQIELLMDGSDWPATPDEANTVGSDVELARRVAAWRANPVGTPAADLHERMKRRRESP